jgi:proteasome accessory factor A
VRSEAARDFPTGSFRTPHSALRTSFRIAEKAPSLNCFVGFGGLVGDRPVIGFGHFFKAAVFDWLRAPRAYFHLLRRRHRLQIMMGDSNMAEMAEYLRVGTTLLVLDLIEAGEGRDLPRVRRPLKALKTLSADPSLQATVRVAGGQRLTALELQRRYLDACRRFLERQDEPDEEALDVLEQWQSALDRLEADPESLVGSLDWITKRYLIDEAGEGSTWEERKKIDLRYHELSHEGYFVRLQDAGLAPRLTDDSQIDWAIRTPPPDSPAATRGRYIREFSSGPQPLSVNWDFVFLGRGALAKVVRLARFNRRESPAREKNS